MSYVETTKLASAVAANDLVRAYVSADGHGKVFLRGDEASGATADRNSALLPSVSSVVQITQETQNVLPASNNTSTVNGPVHIFLTPAATDTVNAASVQSPWLEGTAVVVVATGSGT
jgi:hypothetical protein